MDDENGLLEEEVLWKNLVRVVMNTAVEGSID